METIYGKFILIHQEDSIIFRKIPDIYFNYDFVGAPFFNKMIGNGGFSLRNKDKMIIFVKDIMISMKKNGK